MTPDTFKLYISDSSKCVLQRGSEEWKCESTLEALELARKALPKQRARLEIFDEKGQRFMILPI